MKYKIDIRLFRKIIRSLKMRMIRKIALIIMPEIMTGKVFLRGAKRIIAFRMNRIMAFANHTL
jgi:hypothetical protein